MRKCILVVLCLISAGAAFAGQGPELKRSGQPIKLKANELYTDSNNRTATFVGNVSARQGDITIYADRLVISYSEKSKEVDRVEGSGNVRIVQGNRLGLAGHAVYENNSGQIILDDNPKVYQGNDVVSGKVIIYYVEDQRSVVKSGPNKRVEAEIHPGGKGTDSGAKP